MVQALHDSIRQRSELDALPGWKPGAVSVWAGQSRDEPSVMTKKSVFHQILSSCVLNMPTAMHSTIGHYTTPDRAEIGIHCLHGRSRQAGLVICHHE